ncbi:MAG TPA: hypothetical protein PK095_24255 [Myxococcota bacterium]|nr:hypothetical protein [Myxococcota bacterium]
MNETTPRPDHIPAELTERAEALAHELASHAGVLPVVFGTFAMELATEWFERVTPLDGDGAPIVLLPRMHRWLVTKLGESDAIFVFSGRENAVVRGRALASEQGVAFFAIGPAGAVTDRMPASKTWDVAEFDATPVEGPVEVAEEKSDPPTLEIRIEKKGRKYLVLIGDVVVATASNKQRALKRADLLRQDPDLMNQAQAEATEAA